MITVGCCVRFRSMVDPGDSDARFTVLEVNGDRLLVRLVCRLPIPPTSVVMESEVILVEDSR